MIIIFESPDNLGKDTQIKLLQKFLIDKPTHIFHYSNISGISNKDCKKYSKKLYTDTFKIIKKLYKNRHLIFNRFLIGEYVYSPIYRNYNGDYIFNIEKKYCNEKFWDDIYLISFTDSIENIINREDGKSFSIDPLIKQQEISLFKEAIEKSIIKNKIIIDINGKSIEQVHQEIYKFLGV